MSHVKEPNLWIYVPGAKVDDFVATMPDFGLSKSSYLSTAFVGEDLAVSQMRSWAWGSPHTHSLRSSVCVVDKGE